MNIYDKDGNIRCVVKKFSYNDTFMGETFLTMDIESPNAISFEIGDNCSYRDDIFTLNYIPSVEKTASAGSRGDAFKYASVKMNSVADELTRCRMLDIVPDDMNVVWTGLPEFSFYAQTVNDLARRLQANLDSLYKGDRKWTVTTKLENLVDYEGVLCSVSLKNPIDAVMSISGKSCMEILAECWNTFRVTYIIRGRTITIAPTPIEVGATFGYGKGKGLYGLQQQTKQDAQIITRLYVYGSTKNIGNHYYANLTGKGKGTIDSTVSSLETERLSFDAATGIIHDGTVDLTLGGVTHNIPMTTSLNVANTVRDHIYDLRATEFPHWTLTKGDANSVIRVDFSATDKYICVDTNSLLTIEFQGQTLYVPFTKQSSYSQVYSFVDSIYTKFVDANDSGGDVPQNWSIVNYVKGDTHLDFKCNTAGPRRNAEITSNAITGLGVTPTLTEKGALYIDFKVNSGGGRLEAPTINVNSTGLIASVFTSTYGLYPYGTDSNLYYFTLDFAYGTKYYKESTTQNGTTQYIVKFKAGDIEVNGYIELDDTHVVGIVYKSEPSSDAFYSAMQSATYIYITSGLYLDLLSSEYVSYNETISGNLAVNRLMLPDFPLVHNSPNDVYLDSPNISKYGIRQGYVIFDGSDASKPEIYPTIHQMTAKNVIDSGITLSLDSAEGTDMSKIRLDEIKGVIMPTDGTKDGNIPTSVDYNYNSWQNTFTIFLKDLGFDLSQGEGKYYYATSDNMSISMISGTCAGREFKIDSIKRNTDLGYLRYELVCERSQDTNINKVYPYDSYPVTAGDEFVILNCRLPKVYVDANAQKLKEYGQAYLSKNDKTKYTYIPKVDEIWMDKHPTIANSIKAGDIFDFSDTDLNLNVKSFIHTLSIKVGDKILPSYDITLDEEVESTTIQKIQNQIDNISLATYASTNITGVQQATATLKVGNLSVGKIPCNTINGLADSPLYTDGTNVTSTVNITAPTVSATAMNATTFIGELQGNAATATKLKTARTLWGQSFDGSGNISGIQTFSTLGFATNWNSVWSDGTNSHPWYGYDHRYPNTGIFSTTISDYSGLTLKTSQGILCIDENGKVGIGTTSPAYKLDVNGNARIASDLYADATVGTRNFASHTTGWNVSANGAADFRNFYADELRVQAFTADISQALAGSDYLTKSVSKLSANFVVPDVNSTVPIIVDDIEGSMPATQCFANGDYIRFRAFNRTSGLTIADVWGTVTLDTTYGTKGFLNGTQAYTFTCKATSGEGLKVFKGSEVLDYGISGSGLIARTTLDRQGSPYEQIATWQGDPSNSSNYTVHARLGNLNGIANCNGYGLYSNKAFLTDSVTVGDLTKTNHYLDFNNGKLTVQGDIRLSSGESVVSTFDMSNGISLAVNNIQIGGRNLISMSTLGPDEGSEPFTSVNAATNTFTTTVYPVGYGHFGFGLPPSSVLSSHSSYTLSGYIKSSIAVTLGVDINNNFSDKSIVLAANNFTYFCVTFSGVAVTAGEWLYIYFTPHGGEDGFTVTFDRLKLEEGNKATTFTPAPEDVDANIATAQSTAIDTAASNAASLYATSSQVTILQDSINLKVGVLSGNILTGTMFRKEEEVTWNNASDKGVISTAVQLGGVNSVYLESTSEAQTWKGVMWTRIPVTAGKKYNMSFWYRTPDTASNGNFIIEVQAFKADGTRAAVFNPLVNWQLPIPANDTWKLYSADMTIGSDVAAVDVLIYLATKGKMYVARPMLIEGKYVGWQRSEQDYDYTGGNLLDETKTLTKRGNLTAIIGTVAANAVGVCSSVYASATSEYADFIRWQIPYDLNADYTLSFMAKGTGKIQTFIYSDASTADVALFTETECETYDVGAWGSSDYTLTPDWKRRTVRWRTKGTRTRANALVVIRVDQNSEAYIAQPKLEKGCVATAWTEDDGDMVSTKALLATGVDINSRSINMTAGQFRWQDNSGNAVAEWSDGKAKFSGDMFAKTFSTTNDTFTVDESGNVRITGYVNATSGSIGGLGITERGLGYGASTTSWNPSITGTIYGQGMLMTGGGCFFGTAGKTTVSIGEKASVYGVLGLSDDLSDQQKYHTTIPGMWAYINSASMVIAHASSIEEGGLPIGSTGMAGLIIDSNTNGIISPANNIFGGIAGGVILAYSLTGAMTNAIKLNRVLVLVTTNTSEMTVALPSEPYDGQLFVIVQRGAKVNITSGKPMRFGSRTSNSANSNNAGQWSLFVYDGNSWDCTLASGALF